MNKQELIKEFREVGVYNLNIFGTEIKAIPTEIAIMSIEQLDEPERVKIPQFVAEHIKRAKEIGRDLQDAMNSSSIHEEVDQWLYTDNNMDTFARAWLDGYEVEEEKRYLVKMKNINIDSAYLKHQLQNNHWYWGSLTECGAFSPYHTKKELEADDFGWVFDCERIEIEEVE